MIQNEDDEDDYIRNSNEELQQYFNQRDFEEEFERVHQSMTSLHQSALEILTGNLDRSNIDIKTRETINKKYLML